MWTRGAQAHAHIQSIDYDFGNEQVRNKNIKHKQQIGSIWLKLLLKKLFGKLFSTQFTSKSGTIFSSGIFICENRGKLTRAHARTHAYCTTMPVNVCKHIHTHTYKYTNLHPSASRPTESIPFKMIFPKCIMCLLVWTTSMGPK